MNLTRCPKGHFYDAEKYPACPHCGSGSGQNETIAFQGGDPNIMGGIPVDDGKTVSGEDLVKNGVNTKGPDNTPTEKKEQKDTVNYIGVPRTDPAQPVVGWLVCTKGRHMGKDYRLVTGRNFIGRSGTMSVALEGENSVSRENHAIVAYEPRQSIFIAQPGSASELFYLNGSVVLDPVRLKQGDRLLLGEVELMLIPCCDDKFKWEIKK